MTVTNRQLSTLAIVAAGLIVVTAILYGIEPKPSTGFQEGALLVQGLEVGKVAALSIKDKDETLEFKKQGDTFSLVQRSGYPASTKEINDLLVKILEIRCKEKVTDDAENHAELGVTADHEDATIVTLLDSEGKPLVGVIIGKSAERASGAYVRLDGQDTVYLAEKSVWVSTSPNSYLETEIVDVKSDDVEQIQVDLEKESYTLKVEDGKKVIVGKVPEGKRSKDTELDSVFRALSALTLDNVMPAAEAADLKWDATFTCKTKKHKTYIAQLAKKDDKHYIRISARGPSDDTIQKYSTLSKDDPKEELEKKDAVFQARDDAIAFTRKHAKWVYEVSDWEAKKMRKSLDDLLEDIPKPDEPEEIAASHILIAYKGSERAGDDITRSKEDAKKRAEDVLEKAKPDDADFAALAKEYSDGPSKDKGGDLGTFKKGKMHKNFEEAAWKLEVGDISDVVESPFGFHIIKRTK